MRRIGCSALLAVCCSPLLLQAQTSSAKAIGSYCSQIAKDATRRHADALLFAAIPVNQDPARDRWRGISASELASVERNGNSIAAVTLEKRKVVYVDATLQNQFGDSALRAQYCFRRDGALARLHSVLTSYHGEMRVIRTILFDEGGTQIVNRVQSFDLQTGKPRSLPSDFWDFPPPIFLSARDLPFAKELP